MPYIRKEKREKFSKVIEALRNAQPENAAELNYLFSMIAAGYTKADFTYQRINDVIGALEGCKQEIYRRQAAPYEDKSIVNNGDL
jgi:hypothetical protein